MNPLYEWARAWGIPDVALRDLEQRLGLPPPVEALASAVETLASEARVQALVRLESARKGVYLWRNNVGAGKLAGGGFIRWGLANDSNILNARLKSADLIGIRKRLITHADVGTHIGQFVSREIKQEGWKYDPTDKKENAQMAWALLVSAQGGDAKFATGEGTL